ncbi:MCP four helix bundle domain-containing protein [Larkinella bovis]|uniref:MCP four helix bundle domain-containing protein n=1 Tax=Larkinella bovis TaxID=683041 RepID=A0ABW0I9S7_9BACT
MKLSGIAQQKLKAALLLLPVMVAVILTSLSMRSTMQEVDQALGSVYTDRLEPAVEMVYLSEKFHAKRHLLETWLMAPNKSSARITEARLKEYDAGIEQSIGQFEKTKLVAEEQKSLLAIKTVLADYRKLEKTVLQQGSSDQIEAASHTFKGPGAVLFQQGVTHLHDLARIQSVVGEEFRKKSHTDALHFYANSTLQIAIAVIMGLIILNIIHNLNRTEAEAFHLN